MISNRRTITWILMLIVALGVICVGAPDVLAQQDQTRKVKKEVKPEYPALAMNWRLSGTVRVAVIIDASGKVKNAHALGGPPLFLSAAEAAAKQWQFEPAAQETTQVLTFIFVQPGG
jgi:TonB family protein